MGFGGFPQVSRKNRTTLVLLSFFLGGLGVDRFYAGRIGLGICKLIFCVVTFGIWYIIDLILAICGAQRDEYGLPISQW
ncbi:NINE protein [Mycoplasmopsis gallinacea]|uniref:NINE protein n=3 Tax=Mycoplasmopsis gallinacea TaxID=29556 RepID=A0A6H0V386_9BACT|nr:NINE protein [Mycoplasmopsis gallinacea]